MTAETAQTERVLIPGIEEVFDGKKYIIPPLNLKALKKFNGEIEKITIDATPNPIKLDLICQLTLAAAKRNYPNMEADFLEEWIDMGNCWRIFGAMMGQSGFAPAKPGELPAGG